MKKIVFIFCVLCMLYGCADSTATNEPVENKFEAPHISEHIAMDFVTGDYEKIKEAAIRIKENYPGSYDEGYVQYFLDMIEEKEKEKEDAIADIDVRNCIQILKLSTGEPNSAGGVDLYIKWKNTSDKTVKYAYFTCDLYNAVDDRVQDTITRSYSFTGQVTGPIKPGQISGNDGCWQNAWWNSTGDYAKITQIKIEYMDETEILIPQSRIDELFY